MEKEITGNEYVFKLGVKVKDKVTGFEGVTVGAIMYLNGCVQYEVRPFELKDGKMIDAIWIDQQQLDKIGEEKPYTRRGGGGPQSNSDKPSMSHP